MAKIYLYDDNFSSLITLICNLFTLKIVPTDIKSQNNYIPNLIDEPAHLNLKVNNEKILHQLSSRVIYTVYYVFLSENIRKELIIYYFLKNALIYHDEIFYHRELNCVNHALKLANRVKKEAHKLKGFIRFKQMKNGFYYAKFFASTNVISILANHFKKRLCNEYWIIHDEKRNIYAIYDLKKITYLNEDDIVKLELNLSTNEKDIEDLWKSFFKTIAIKERNNLKVQMNFMPKKYWHNLTEMEDIN